MSPITYSLCIHRCTMCFVLVHTRTSTYGQPMGREEGRRSRYYYFSRSPSFVFVPVNYIVDNDGTVYLRAACRTPRVVVVEETRLCERRTAQSNACFTRRDRSRVGFDASREVMCEFPSMESRVTLTTSLTWTCAGHRMCAAMGEDMPRKIELRVSNHKAYIWDVDGMSQSYSS